MERSVLMYRKIHKRMGLILVGMCMFLGTGCGTRNVGTGEVTTGECENPVCYEEEYRNRTPYDILQGEWTGHGEIQKPEVYWKIADYWEPDTGSREGIPGTIEYAVDGTDFYVLSNYYTMDEEGVRVLKEDYYLDRLDCNSMEMESVLFSSLSDGENILSGGSVEGFDVSDGQIVVYVQHFADQEDASGAEAGSTTAFYAVPLEGDGRIGEGLDLLPALKQCGMEPELYTAIQGGLWEARGYYFFCSPDMTAWYVLDREGQVADRIEGGDSKDWIRPVCKSVDGTYLWCRYDADRKKSTYYVYEPGGFKVLYEGPGVFATDCCMNRYGDMMRITGGAALTCWNLATGQYEQCYVGTSSTFRNVVGMIQNEDGHVCVFSNGDALDVTVFSKTGPAVTATLTMEVLGGYDYQARTLVTSYERTHPGITFQVKEHFLNDYDTEWMDVVNRLMIGEGPDLMICPRKEMDILQKKGYLADLSDLLPPETLDSLYSKLVDCGRIDGKLYGLVYDAYVNTLLVDTGVWDGNTWTIGELLDVLEQGAENGEEYIPLRIAGSNDGLSAGYLLYYLLTDLEHSPFLDLETGTCDFTSEEFLRLLQVCKQYDASGRQPEGSVLAERYGIYGTGFVDFSEQMFRLQEEYACVGYPTDSGCGNFWSPRVCIVVNRDTGNREIINDFLKSVYDGNSSFDFMSLTPIHRNVLESRVYTKVDWADGGYLKLDAHSFVPLQLKKNGDSYLTEYESLLENCVPQPIEADEIRDIIFEEAETYFRNHKAPEFVAEAIQSRVTLYLEERK